MDNEMKPARKVRSGAARFIFPEEEMREWQEYREARYDELARNKDYSIGFLFGDLFMQVMPKLSVDWNDPNDKRVIWVSKEDTEKYEPLSENSQQDWNSYIEFRKFLYDKYLPSEIEYWTHVPLEANADFVRGFKASLTDSDRCMYDLTDDKIIIEQEKSMFVTTIKLLK